MYKLCLLLCVTTLFPLASYANYLEFRCDFKNLENEDVQIEVIKRFPRGLTRQIEVRSHVAEGVPRLQVYQASVRERPNFYELSYWAAPLRFTIDLFPDRFPQMGRTYRADFSSPDISQGHRFTNITCRYLNF